MARETRILRALFLRRGIFGPAFCVAVAVRAKRTVAWVGCLCVACIAVLLKTVPFLVLFVSFSPNRFRRCLLVCDKLQP